MMTGKTNKSWLPTMLVAVVCAVIGFGAVYATLGGGDNTLGDGLRPMIPADPPGSTASTASSRQPSTTTAANAKALLTAPNGEALNRGAMTTFVFKNQPEPVTGDKSFNGPDGKAMTIADFKGKVVLLNLWATWCAPCRKEMPSLDALQRELGSDQFEVVAVSVDRGGPEKAANFLAEVGAKALRFYHDPTAQLGFSLMAIGMPATLLIDRDGRELGRLVGPADWHSDDAKRLIQAAIAAG